MIEIKILNNNYIELNTLDNNLWRKIRKHYTFEISSFMVKSKYTWQRNKKPTVCLIKKNKYLPRGLYLDLIKFLKENNYKYRIDKEIYKRNKVSLPSIEKFTDTLLLPFKLHDHQIEAILVALINKRIVLKAATSSGKSLILYVLSMFFNKILKEDEKILIIVPTIQLVGQMYEDFCEYAQNNPNINIFNLVKMFHGGVKKIFNTQNILVSTYQTLNNLKPEFFEQFKYVIVDECHTSKARTIIKVMNQCINADYRIGVTGSVFLKTNQDQMAELNNKTIMGLLGPMKNIISARELIDKKLASDVEIKIKTIDWGKQPIDMEIEDKIQAIKECKHMNKQEKKSAIKSLKDSLYRKELAYIYNNKERDCIINDFIKNNIDKNTLIVFNRKAYGKKLKEHCEKLLPNFKIHHVDGSVKIDDRHELKRFFEESNNNIGIVSVGTFKQGISIKNLHYIVLLQVGKAAISLIQLIGRGMRLHDSKDKMIIFDIVDKLSYVDKYGRIKKKGYLYKHGAERIKIYKSEKHNLEIENL